MKTLNQFITEKLKIGKDFKQHQEYNYFPKDKYQLRKILEQLLKERGKDADLNDIDVSKITDMSADNRGILEYGLFDELDPHNIDISKWDVFNVKDMKYMFSGCLNFNCDLSLWDVSNVRDMKNMFTGCKKFEGKGLETWDVHNVENMYSIFSGCTNFNCDLSNWDVSNVINMFAMFYYCENFEGIGLDNWNVSNVIDMNNIFVRCYNLKNKPSWYKKTF